MNKQKCDCLWLLLFVRNPNDSIWSYDDETKKQEKGNWNRASVRRGKNDSSNTTLFLIINGRKDFGTPFDHCVSFCTKRWWPVNGFRSFEFYHWHSEPLLAKLWSFLSIIGKELFLETTDYGHPMKPFFIEIQNFWSWAFWVFSAKL